MVRGRILITILSVQTKRRGGSCAVISVNGMPLNMRLSRDNSSQTSIRPECREGWHHETNTDTDNVNDDHGSVMGM